MIQSLQRDPGDWGNEGPQLSIVLIAVAMIAVIIVVHKTVERFDKSGRFEWLHVGTIPAIVFVIVAIVSVVRLILK